MLKQYCVHVKVMEMHNSRSVPDAPNAWPHKLGASCVFILLGLTDKAQKGFKHSTKFEFVGMPRTETHALI